MSRRKLRSSGSPISFFAFQDIITAVSGILIIVTLLLALNVGQSHSSAEEEKASAEQESKLARLLDELTVLRRTAERDVTEQVGRATASELKSRAAELNEQAELLATKNAKQKAGAKGMSDDVTVANRAQLLAELGATMNPRKAEILALEGEAERKAAEAKTAAQAVGKAQAALVAEQARKNVLRLIPEPSASNREPVVVQLGARSWSIQRFDIRDKQTGSGLADFRTALASFAPLKQYLVFYGKPSSADDFDAFVEAGRKAGFGVGYDLVAENAEIELHPPEAK